MTQEFICGDALAELRKLPDNHVQCIVTSPPYYGLRDYGHDGQLGNEEHPDEYIANLVAVFREARRVLKPTGTLWLNLGDSYYNHRSGNGQKLAKQSISKTRQDLPTACNRRGRKLAGFKEKEMIGIPHRVAFALSADGWYLRQDIVWHKTNPMPESVKDRCTRSHEYIFLLTKSERYYFDHAAIREPCSEENVRDVLGRRTFANKGTHGGVRADLGRDRREYVAADFKRAKRSVWTVTSQPYKGAHYAVFPPRLIEPCILAGSRPSDIVLDPFGGAGTTALVAMAHERRSISIEINPEHVRQAKHRIVGSLQRG